MLKKIYKAQLGLSTNLISMLPIQTLNTSSINVSSIIPNYQNFMKDNSIYKLPSSENNYNFLKNISNNSGLLKNLSDISSSVFTNPNASTIETGIDSLYNTASDIALQTNPLVGGIMKGNKLVGDVGQALVGKTDNMTGIDSIMNSSIFGSSLGMINSGFGKKSNSIIKNNDVLSKVGSSYSGVENNINNALNKSNKKYGLFSSSARKKANSEISNAQSQQNLISNISDQATRSFESANNPYLSLLTQNQLQGGYNFSNIRYGQDGLKFIINPITKYITPQYNNDYVNYVKNYTPSIKQNDNSSLKFDNYNSFLNYIKSTGRTDPNYDLKSFYNDKSSYNKWLANESKERGSAHFTDLYKLSNHPTFSTDSKYSNNNTMGGTWSDSGNDNWTFTTSPYVESKHSSDELVKYFKLNEPNSTLIYHGKVLYKPVNKMANGGAFNVIPEGSLHARKHNLEKLDPKFKEITNKGIPVVSVAQKGDVLEYDDSGKPIKLADGGEIVLQAEVEKNEIILHLELTKKLEELAEDGSEEAAIEAGKLLVKELLYNTVDNTGLIDEIK